MGESSSNPARRQTLRWTGFDYRIPGIYFVTICTTNREKHLGRVDDTGHLHPSRTGWTVSQAWHHLPERFPNVELISFVAMPDHVHGLLDLLPDTDDGRSSVALGQIISVFKSVSTRQARDLDEHAGRSGSLWQRGYHDRVVRTDDEMRQIEWYIAENPARWAASRMSSEHVGGGASLA